MWISSVIQTNRNLRHSHSQLELLVEERTAALAQLSQRFLRMQDEERRRVARDLHDSTGQTLTALKMSIVVLQGTLTKNKRAHKELLAIARLADDALQEIRTTSYLLHPPLLDEAGFAWAAQWYIDGFAQRSGIKVLAEFALEVPRLPEAIEIALYRVLQESLTNVHRHSGASEVDIRFFREDQAVVLEVRDYGCGIPKEILGAAKDSIGESGVGLASMRERLNDVKGGLEIEPAVPGARLRAIVPLPGAFVGNLEVPMPAIASLQLAQPSL